MISGHLIANNMDQLWIQLLFTAAIVTICWRILPVFEGHGTTCDGKKVESPQWGELPLEKEEILCFPLSSSTPLQFVSSPLSEQPAPVDRRPRKGERYLATYSIYTNTIGIWRGHHSVSVQRIRASFSNWYWSCTSAFKRISSQYWPQSRLQCSLIIVFKSPPPTHMSWSDLRMLVVQMFAVSPKSAAFVNWIITSTKRVLSKPTLLTVAYTRSQPLLIEVHGLLAPF